MYVLQESMYAGCVVKMGKDCAWTDCENTVVFGDEEAKTEFGEMCPYDKATIVMYSRSPPKPKTGDS
jgi:hypothetical protein